MLYHVGEMADILKMSTLIKLLVKRKNVSYFTEKKPSKLVNFCTAILIGTWKKICNIFGILCFIISRKVKTQLQCKKRFVQGMEKVQCLTERVRVVCKVLFRDFSLDAAPWLGRPIEVDSDQIKTLIENKQCYTMQEIADILKISKSIKLLVKMKNVSSIL